MKYLHSFVVLLQCTACSIVPWHPLQDKDTGTPKKKIKIQVDLAGQNVQVPRKFMAKILKSGGINCKSRAKALSERPGFSTSQDPSEAASRFPPCHAPESYRILLPRPLAEENRKWILQQESKISRGTGKKGEHDAEGNEESTLPPAFGSVWLKQE